MAKNWAICIGINGYEYIESLRYAERDALVMAKFFQDANFDQVYTFTDSSPPIKDGTRPYESRPTFGRLDWFLLERFKRPFLKPGDNLWFFFSGHGIQNSLMLQDSNPNTIERTGIAISDVTERLRRWGATNVILIVDACRSENSSKGMGFKELHEPGVITLSSCSWGERSYEIEKLEHGSFTYALLESLKLTGENNCATVERLNNRIKSRVIDLNQKHRKPRQTPCSSVEPLDKKYLILLPGQATIRDIERYKMFAYRAESKGELEEARGYWEMLWEIAPGDLEVRDGFQNIVLKMASPLKSEIQTLSPSTTGSKTSDTEPIAPLETSKPSKSPPVAKQYQHKVNHCSEVTARYKRLADLLKAGDWREADEETGQQMLAVVNRTEEGWLDVGDIERISCEFLKSIDDLWTLYSKGRFGFSAQLEVWKKINGEISTQTESLLKEKLGWLDVIQYRKNAKKGHLPHSKVCFKILLVLKRFDSCN